MAPTQQAKDTTSQKPFLIQNGQILVNILQTFVILKYCVF